MVWQLCFHNDRCFLNTQLLFPRKCHQGPTGAGCPGPAWFSEWRPASPGFPGSGLLLLLAHSRWTPGTEAGEGGTGRQSRGTLSNSKPDASHLAYAFVGSFLSPHGRSLRQSERASPFTSLIFPFLDCGMGCNSANFRGSVFNLWEMGIQCSQ